MSPYDQPGDQMGQPMGGPEQAGPPPGEPVATGQQPPPQQPQQVQPISQMSVRTPTLRWVSVGSPQEEIPLGEDDYVLDSVYNAAIDAWEVLVLVQPREGADEAFEDDDEDEEEEEEE